MVEPAWTWWQSATSSWYPQSSSDQNVDQKALTPASPAGWGKDTCICWCCQRHMYCPQQRERSLQGSPTAVQPPVNQQQANIAWQMPNYSPVTSAWHWGHSFVCRSQRLALGLFEYKAIQAATCKLQLSGIVGSHLFATQRS